MKNIKKLFKDKKNRKLIILGISLIVLIISIGVITNNLNSSHANPTSANFLRDQVVDNLLFTRTKFSDDTLIVIVKNTTDEDYKLKSIDVSFYDTSKNLITTVKGYIGDEIAQDGYKQLVVSTEKDLSKADSITYTINK